MTPSKRAASPAALVALIALATALAGCGNGKQDRSLLTTTRATQLRSTLDAVERMVDAGDCQGATTTALAFEQKVNALPARVDASLRDSLTSGASRLQQLVGSQCAPVGPTGPTQQAPQETDNGGPGKNGKGKAKGHNKDKNQENPEEGTTGPTVPPDQNLGITTP
jgi:hypothetical protein